MVPFWKFLHLQKEVSAFSGLTSFLFSFPIEHTHVLFQKVTNKGFDDRNGNRIANKYIMRALSTINQAFRLQNKVGFTYFKHTLQDQSAQAARKGGQAYILSPYKLLINDGNYCLLAYDSKKEDLVDLDLLNLKKSKTNTCKISCA